MEITIRGGTHLSVNVLREKLEANLGSAKSDCALTLRPSGRKLRALDPMVLVAVVGAGGTVLGALITSIAQIAKEATAKTIVLQTRGGARVEIPVGIPPDEIDQLIDKLGKLDAEHVSLSIH